MSVSGIDWSAFVKVFQTLTETIGKVVQTYFQLEAMDAQINQHASGIASNDRVKQDQATQSLEEKLQIDNAKTKDEIKAQEELKQAIIADTGNVGLKGNQATIASTINSSSIHSNDGQNYSNANGAVLFTKQDLDLALNDEPFTAAPAGSTKDQIVSHMQNQVTEKRAAQEKILKAISANANEGSQVKNVINPNGTVDFKQLDAYTKSQEGRENLANMSADDRKQVDKQFKAWGASSTKLNAEYIEFKRLGGTVAGSEKLSAEAADSLNRRADNGNSFDRRDTSYKQGSMAPLIEARRSFVA